MFRILFGRTFMRNIVGCSRNTRLTPAGIAGSRFAADFHTSPEHRGDNAGKNPHDVIGSYDPTWLRENCRCSDCFSHVTAQRKVLFYDLQPEQRTVANVRLAPSPGDKITVEWTDGHVSEYDPDWLARNVHPGDPDPVERRLWDGATFNALSPDRIPREAFQNRDKGIKRLVRNLVVYGFGLVQGVEPTPEATRELAERVSYIRKTIFGGMWSLTSDMAREDLAYTKVDLGAHTDTTYFSEPAGIQVFHCIEHDGHGGETLLVDGFNAAQRLLRDDPEGFRMLCRHPIHHEYREKQAGQTYQLRSLAPVLATNPASGELVSIRYNHNDRSPISTIPQPEVAAYYDALAALSRRITDPDAEFWIKLNPGMVLFVDNWRVLHEPVPSVEPVPPVEPVPSVSEPPNPYAGDLGDFVQPEAHDEPEMEAPIPLPRPVAAEPGPISYTQVPASTERGKASLVDSVHP
ncbi:hypothetical protein LSH36_814g02011 [Paralvinella palmiformis]|uniref:Trimethyllysine dioxygenase, mitochondrial n=1 Tax=Paralvinella palmiformis TaxID=53620 RepID=A0AAD9IZH9_9ANNE|nr:hypothetical protein LSH36_814g02011 [Paralvinella palmiformis]